MNIPDNTFQKAKEKLSYFHNRTNEDQYNKNDLVNEIIQTVTDTPIITTIRISETNETLLMLLAQINIKDNMLMAIKKIFHSTSNEILESIDTLNTTALMYAAIFNNHFFLEAVMDNLNITHFNVKNLDDKTAFILATEYNSKEFLEKVFELKFNISQEDKEQSLLLATEKGHETIVEFLVSKENNCNVKNSAGLTLLEVAIQNGRYNIAFLLIKQYPTKRFILTAECFSLLLKEISQYNPDKTIGILLKNSSYTIEKIAGMLNYLVNTKLLSHPPLPMTKCTQKIYNIMPHWIEDFCVTGENKNKAIQELFVGSGNHSRNSGSANTIVGRSPTEIQVRSEVTIVERVIHAISNASADRRAYLSRRLLTTSTASSTLPTTPQNSHEY